MRRELPSNNVSHNYRAVLDTFVKKLLEQQSENIQAVLLSGSYARGDADVSSDLDIWCLFQKINYDILTSVGKVARSLPVQYDQLELNAQCLTVAEFECGHFSNFISPPVIYLESILIYGSYAIREPSTDEIEHTYKKILAEVLLTVRHYICVEEPKENLTYRKLSAFILKPLMFALRLERYSNAGHYPLSTTDLLQACESDYAVLVNWFLHRDLLELHVLNDHQHVLETLSSLIENLL
ncbi:MAG: nucleotidyltransferase domain-containing protein [Oscillospiraceae bacterium]|nr:nucleotidyltransferase domain-containing protein [Oscillospiraceae bacterium]